MSTNTFPDIQYRINSCLVGANSYRSLSDMAEFLGSRLEELTDEIRQGDGRCYLRCNCGNQNRELWMVPFQMPQRKLRRLQEAVEQIMDCHLGADNFCFPFDVAASDECLAYVMTPIDREASIPIRRFLPYSHAPRWEMSVSLFRRVSQLNAMGLTSNGISREQIRVRRDNGEVVLWLNETVCRLEDSAKTDGTSRHEGFCAVPMLTEQKCAELGLTLTGAMRDVYSAAVIAFYLIMYTHPFVGSAYYRLLRDDYLMQYLYWPQYIMAPGTENNPGNQTLSMVVEHQWNQTLPELRALFDGIFNAVEQPQSFWDPNADYWKPECWIAALTADAEVNDNPSSRTDFNFNDERYHQV